MRQGSVPSPLRGRAYVRLVEDSAARAHCASCSCGNSIAIDTKAERFWERWRMLATLGDHVAIALARQAVGMICGHLLAGHPCNLQVVEASLIHVGKCFDQKTNNVILRGKITLDKSQNHC
jgi:hypothetical protein